MKLELFMSDHCPFCRLVKGEIEAQGRTDIEFCNIEQSDAHLNRLVTVGGKKQIPCLFVDGKPMYESQDIIKWLKANPQT